MCRKSTECVKGPFQFCDNRKEEPLCQGCARHKQLYTAAAASDAGKRAARFVLLMAELCDQLRDFMDEGHGDECDCPLCAFLSSDRADRSATHILQEFSHAAWALNAAGCLIDGELPAILSAHDRAKRIKKLLAEVAESDGALTRALTRRKPRRALALAAA